MIHIVEQITQIRKLIPTTLLRGWFFYMEEQLNKFIRLIKMLVVGSERATEHCGGWMQIGSNEENWT